MDGVMIAQVCVERTVYRIDKPYDYILPKELGCDNPVGKRVLIPFGNGNSTRQGFVIGVKGDSDYGKKLKKIVAVLDDEPILNEECRILVEKLKERTFCTYFDAIRVLLPAGISMRVRVAYAYKDGCDRTPSADEAAVLQYLQKRGDYEVRETVLKRFGYTESSTLLEKMFKKGMLSRNDFAGRRLSDPTVKMVRLVKENVPEKLTDKQKAVIEKLNEIGACDVKELFDKQKAVIEKLNEIGACDVKELCYFLGITAAVVNNLEKKGVLEFFKQAQKPEKPLSKPISKKTIALSQEQQAVYERLKEKCGAYSANLLYGVTGSGKTQVFLKVADDVVEKGLGVIVMVPEIALTPQTIAIFTARYGNRVAVIHSAMSTRQRMNEWRRIKNGEALVAVGTRSAVFAPFEKIGLVIIDEEQEHTYKSEQSPKYHARDVAKLRCAYHGAPLILASATPSVESYTAALQGRYEMLRLKSRYGTARLPEVTIVDMRHDMHGGNASVLSRELQNRLSDTLQKKQQAILLMNRRGYNTYVSCGSCGDVVTCPNCSISLIYHSANGRLMCHYCGYSVPYTDKCSSCGGTHMKYTGVGTQRVEEELKMLYPDARVLRMDADTTLAHNSYQSKLTAFAEGEYDIMLGTQMVAKGLDFERVTLVGVLNADRAMHSADFKSYERTFSLLTQVVGRAGRGKNGGTAVVQTVQPDSNIIALAARQDYDSFYKDEILTRKLMIYPPYCEIAELLFQGTDKLKTERAAKYFFSLTVAAVEGDFKELKLNILGPTAAEVPRINKKYRYRLIIKFRDFRQLQQMINDCLGKFYASDEAKSATVSIDINPE